MTADLTKLIVEAQVLAGDEHQCAVLGHEWVSTGGSWCGCKGGGCSIPVHECSHCGDCDYGYNEDADTIKEMCRALS